MLERPLVVGFAWGVFTGEYTISFNIAIFYELFWLDLIPVGTFIPPHLTAVTFSALSLTTFFGLSNPARIMGVILACMPLAWFGSKVEMWIRDQERAGYNKLLHWVRQSGTSSGPGMLVLRSLVRTFVVSWVAFFGAVLVLMYLFDTLFTLYPGMLSSVDVKWAHLWGAATLGGLMALRLQRAYAVLATGVVLFVLFVLFA